MYNLIKSKGCQRCGGDLFLERENGEVYVTCLQCSAVHAEYSEQELKNAGAAMKVKSGQKGYGG